MCDKRVTHVNTEDKNMASKGNKRPSDEVSVFSCQYIIHAFAAIPRRNNSPYLLAWAVSSGSALPLAWLTTCQMCFDCGTGSWSRRVDTLQKT